MGAAGITQHFELMCYTVVPSQSVIAVVCLVKCKQYAEKLRHFVLDGTLSDSNSDCAILLLVILLLLTLVGTLA